jgi:hypothetical protein
MTHETKSLRLARWMDRLSMYDCEIIYRESKRNGNADALSRIATEETAEDEANRAENKDFIINAVDTHVNAIKINVGRIDALTDPDKPHPPAANEEQQILAKQLKRFRISGTNVWREGYDNDGHLQFQFVAPAASRLEIVRQNHDDQLAGYLG